MVNFRLPLAFDRTKDRPRNVGASDAAYRYRHSGRRPCWFDRGRHAGARRLRRRRWSIPTTIYPPDLRCEKLDGPQVNVLRRTGPRRCGAACRHARWRMLDRALRPTGREAARRSIRHPLRHARQHDPRPRSRRAPNSSTPRSPRSRTARTGRSSRCRPASEISARLVVVANGLEYRPASRARHDARGREPVSLDHHRVRSQAGRAQPIRFPGADLLSRSARPTAWPTSRCSRSAPRCAPTSWSIAT